MHGVDKNAPVFSCDKCNYKTGQKKELEYNSALYQHNRTKHMNVYNFKCTMCKFKSISQKNLDKHIEDNHDPNNPFICKECGKEFRIKCYLAEHIKRCHKEDAVKKHLCSVCGKAFAESTKYMLHYLAHAKVRPYECNICREKFTQRVTMMAHWKKKHPDVDEKPPTFSLADFFKSWQTKGLEHIVGES